MPQNLDSDEATGQFIFSSEHLADDACTNGLDDMEPTASNITRAQELEVATLFHDSFTR